MTHQSRTGYQYLLSLLSLRCHYESFSEYCLLLHPFQIIVITSMFHLTIEVYEHVSRQTENCL